MAPVPRLPTVCLSLGIVTIVLHLILPQTPLRPIPAPLPQIPGRNNKTTTIINSNNNNNNKRTTNTVNNNNNSNNTTTTTTVSNNNNSNNNKSTTNTVNNNNNNSNNNKTTTTTTVNNNNNNKSTTNTVNNNNNNNNNKSPSVNNNTTITSINNRKITTTVITNNNNNNRHQDRKTPSGRKETSNFYESGDGGGENGRGGGGEGGNSGGDGGLPHGTPLAPEAEKLSSIEASEVKECKVRVNLSPCPCERIVTATVPRCDGETAAVVSVKAALGDSTCSDWATARGGNQRVISYSLFGAFPSPYYRGIEELAGQVPRAYPGWTMRVHHALNVSNSAQREWLCALACKHSHLDFCPAHQLSGGVGDLRGSVGSVWRVAVLGDPLVSRYMIRDADAPLLTREVEAVNEWLSSGKCFHVMRDSPHHDQAVMAGLWGGCGDWHAAALPRLRDQLFRWCPSRAPPSVDQLYVNMLLWPLIRRNVTTHDAYHCDSFTAARPFPTQRDGRAFVGMRSFRPAHAQDALAEPCPAHCRPKEHLNWEFC